MINNIKNLKFDNNKYKNCLLIKKGEAIRCKASPQKKTIHPQYPHQQQIPY